MSDSDKRFIAIVASIVIDVILTLNNRYHFGKMIIDLENRLLDKLNAPDGTAPRSENRRE